MAVCKLSALARTARLVALCNISSCIPYYSSSHLDQGTIQLICAAQDVQASHQLQQAHGPPSAHDINISTLVPVLPAATRQSNSRNSGDVGKGADCQPRAPRKRTVVTFHAPCRPAVPSMPHGSRLYLLYLTTSSATAILFAHGTAESHPVRQGDRLLADHTGLVKIEINLGALLEKSMVCGGVGRSRKHFPFRLLPRTLLHGTCQSMHRQSRNMS
jgi:hypothetical protein